MNTKLLCMLTGSVAVLALSTPAVAQNKAGAAQAAPAAENDAAANDDGNIIIVTGTAGGAGIRKQDASFAITTIGSEDISQAGLKSTAEVFSMVPGVWSESSGGKAGANIDVRGLPGGGDAPFVTLAINGAPLYGTPSLSFLEQSTIFRVDETIGGVEALRGGPNAVFGRGEPGVTLNFRLKEGGEETKGRAKFTTSDYGLYQLDGVISGHLGGDFYYMVGGYWSTSPGVRDAGFQSEKGEQITAQLTWKGSRGKVNLFTRWTDDVGQWYLPMSTVSGNDLNYFSQLGPKTRYRTLQIDQTGKTRTFDMANGRGWRGSLSGLNAEFELSDSLTVRDNAAYVSGSADTYGFVPDGGPVRVSALPGGTARTRDGVVLAGTEYVQNYGDWVVTKDLKSFTNDLSMAWKAGKNELTVGYYHAGFSSKDFWTLGNFTPVHNVHQGDYLSSATTCATLQAAGSQSGCWAYGIASDGHAKVNAFYIADSFNATDKLRIDAGARREWLDLDYVVDSGPGYPDGTLDLIGRNTSPQVKLKRSAWAYTLAANYAFTDSFGAFARYSDGFTMPMFDNIRDNQDNNRKIQQFEGGLKYSGDNFRMFATLFHNKNDSATGGVGSVLPPTKFHTKATGVELDGALTFGNFNLGVIATYQDAIVDASANSTLVNKTIPRQPKFQVRISPSYTFDLGDWKLDVYGAFAYAGDRWGNYQNTIAIGKLRKLDAGIKIRSPHGFFGQIAADNLLNSEDLTESDGRSLSTANGRPILGRSFRFSVGYDF